VSEVRPLQVGDLPAVAQLFQRTFRDARKAPPASLVDYLRSLYLEAPDQDAQIASQVYVRPGGQVAGFIGVTALPMALDGRALRAAVCGALMVDDHDHDPLAGARLMRAFLAGPQDLSLSETANATSTAMWRRSKGVVLPDYSFDWFRIIRPARFGLELAASAFGPARLAAPLAAAADAALSRRQAKSTAPGHPGKRHEDIVQAVDVDEDMLLELIPRFLVSYPLHPAWGRESLRSVLRDAARKADYGACVKCAVLGRGGEPVGLFIYHGLRGHIGRVLQILASPGHEGAVFDSLSAHAAAAGLAGLRGRTQPRLLDALLGRPCFLRHTGSTVVHSRDPAHTAPFVEGRAFFNGLAGEGWTRLAGDAFS